MKIAGANCLQIGRARAQRFDWEDTARAVLDVYREITS